MKERAKILLLWLAGFLYTLPVYNKYWAPFDEGIIAVAAQRLLAGEILYKDIFLVMYPPGQVYLLAGLFKIFNGSLIAGRIYAVFVTATIALMAFLITKKLTRVRLAPIIAYLIALSSLGPRLGTIPAPILPGMLLGLIAIYAFICYLERTRTSYIIVSGLISGLSVMFRHDVGIFVSIAILIPLLLYSFKKRSLKAVLIFIAGITFITSIWVAYLASLYAAKDLFDSLIMFPSINETINHIQLPKPCFDLNMIFHQSLQFININQFYIPVIVYIFTAVLILNSIVRKGFGFSNEDLARAAVLIFGILIFKAVIWRADPAHLCSMVVPAVILGVVVMGESFSGKFRAGPAIVIKRSISVILALLFLLFVIKNTDKYIKNGYTKVFKKAIIKTSFDKGTIYVPKEEREDVLGAIKFIRENTGAGERIYLGNSVHWKEDFGGTLLFYYLADRLPSTKYYELLPGLVTTKKFQEEVVGSLAAKDVRFLVLQDVETGGLKKEDAPPQKRRLDDFIQANYREVARFGKYGIYRRR